MLTPCHLLPPPRRKLLGALPERDAIRNWAKVYCMARDGASLGTLMYKVYITQRGTWGGIALLLVVG